MNMKVVSVTFDAQAAEGWEILELDWTGAATACIVQAESPCCSKFYQCRFLIEEIAKSAKDGATWSCVYENADYPALRC